MNKITTQRISNAILAMCAFWPQAAAIEPQGPSQGSSFGVAIGLTHAPIIADGIVEQLYTIKP